MTGSAPRQAPESDVREVRRTVVVLDLAGYAALFSRADDLAIAAFLDAFYRLCGRSIEAAGGRVVKFIGDACLAVFDPGATVAAVESAIGLAGRIRDLGRDHGFDLDVGVNIHLTNLVEGAFGPAGLDVVGSGVNHAFLMGRGPGLRISEPVYRQLPSDRRGPWTRRQAPATYFHGAG